MSLIDKIEDISNFIFEQYGIIKDFPEKKKLFIHDNVFGTLSFTSFERKVIATPYLQRLTGICQMGLANFVYPGAVHNRFSHSLGVSYIAEKIYRNIISECPDRKNKIDCDVNTLKLAGLVHDIGHGPFSHISEEVINALSYLKCINSVDAEICAGSSSGLKRTRKNYHEFLGYHLLKSEKVKSLLNEIYKDIPIDLELVPLCITGNSLPFKGDNGEYSIKFKDKYKTLLINVINSYSDADKIDYLLRDSKFSGLPLPADIERLLSFFTIIEENGKYELGVSEKGTRAFNLLLISKAKMFPTVYHHHTTLACESLLIFGIVDAIRNVQEIYSNSKLDKKIWPPIECGTDLLYYTDKSLLEYLRIIKNPISNDVIKRLGNRRHYRIIRRFYTWELQGKLIMNQINFIKKLKNENQYSELEDLWNKNKKQTYNIRLEEKYDDYKADEQKKIDHLYDDFEDYEKLLKFKQDLLSKEPNVLEKLKRDLPGVEEEVLTDYVIKVRIGGRREVTEEYRQPYIKVKDVFSNKTHNLPLKAMGYSIPNSLDYQQIIFFCLPEFVESLTPHFDKFIEDHLDIKFS